jgi:hypothetical protein
MEWLWFSVALAALTFIVVGAFAWNLKTACRAAVIAGLAPTVLALVGLGAWFGYNATIWFADVARIPAASVQVTIVVVGIFIVCMLLIRWTAPTSPPNSALQNERRFPADTLKRHEQNWLDSEQPFSNRVMEQGFRRNSEQAPKRKPE